MRTLFCAVVLAALATGPVAAQSTSEPPSDRYTRDRPQTDADQQAQTRDRRHSGQVETLRRDHMSSPNVKGESVPEDPATGVPEPTRRSRPSGEDQPSRP